MQRLLMIVAALLITGNVAFLLLVSTTSCTPAINQDEFAILALAMISKQRISNTNLVDDLTQGCPLGRGMQAPITRIIEQILCADELQRLDAISH